MTFKYYELVVRKGNDLETLGPWATFEEARVFWEGLQRDGFTTSVVRVTRELITQSIMEDNPQEIVEHLT